MTESSASRKCGVSLARFPRTQDEITARIREAQERDVLGFEWQEYLEALDYDHLVPFLQRDATLTREEHAALESDYDTPEKLSASAHRYMDFWMEKIEGERGISVCRATMHFRAWKWLLGHPDADTFPGADYLGKADGGWYQRDAYDYVRAQIDSGEFDRLTAEAARKEEIVTIRTDDRLVMFRKKSLLKAFGLDEDQLSRVFRIYACEHAEEDGVLYGWNSELLCVECLADRVAKLERDKTFHESIVSKLEEQRLALVSLVGFNPGGDARLDEHMEAARVRLRNRSRL